MLRFLKNIGLRPNKFRFTKHLENKNISILDVGCGNNSVFTTKIFFPDCKYYGLDSIEKYKDDKDGKAFMEKFYLIDLDKDSLDLVENDKFDFIIISHVIEHLKKGDIVIRELIKKLKKDGYIYIEYPSTKSLSSPSMKGTLHFSDDDTHVRLYDVKELGNIFLENNTKIIKGGYVRSCIKIVSFPVFYILVKLFGFSPNLLWDHYRFAEFIIGQKK